MKTCRFSRVLLLALMTSCANGAWGQSLPDLTALPWNSGDITGSVSAPGRLLRLTPSEGDPSAIMVPVFRRIAVDPQQMRVDGEVGVADLPVFLKPDQLREPARLRLRYISSVSVMPEASHMLVYANDQLVADIMLDSAAEPGVVELPIPLGLLQPGYNAIRLAVQQRHRVDCSIEAANELWTQVDPAGSGLMLVSANDPITTIDGLRGLPEGEDGSVPITVIMPQGSDLGMLDQAMRAAQALAIRADIQKPNVTIANAPTGKGGIELHVGLPSALAAGARAVMDEASGVQVIGRSVNSVMIVISGRKVEDIETAILRLSTDAPRNVHMGTEAGQRALSFQRGVPIEANGQVDLNRFGIATQEFSGRLFRTSFNLIVPPDFYPADNGKARLYLDGEYTAGLLGTNEALVRINGKIVGATRLTRASGEAFSRRAIEMSLRVLSPGHNRVTLEIRTGTEGDRDCNPLSLIDSTRRLTVQASTSFALPAFARANYLPALGSLTSHGHPFATLGKPVQLYMPRPDPVALSAAATLLARIAVSTGSPTAVRISTRMPDDSTGAALIVGAIADMPESLLQHFEMDDARLPATWRNARHARHALPSPTLPSPAPQVANPLVRSNTSAVATPVSASAPAPARSAKAPEEAKSEPPKPLLERSLDAISRFLQRNIGYRPEQLAFLQHGLARPDISQTSTIVLAEAVARGKTGEPWVLLTGVTNDALQRNVIDLVSPPQWQQTSGRVVAYDPESRTLSSIASAYDQHIQMSERSMGNLTLFAAGWLSNNIHYYTVLLITVCVFFGIFSRKLLNRVGQKP